MFLADLYNNKRLFENMSPIDLAEILFNALMQKYPEAVKRYGHEVVGDAVMNYAEDAEDIRSMSDVDIAVQEIIDDLANYRGDRTNDLEPDSDAPLQENQQLSIQDLAVISDQALDAAYGYGRSSPGNTFGWQANLQSAAYAKKVIDAGVTDIETIADAIHKGWNQTAKAFVSNPDQFSDTEKLKAAGKLEAKLQQRAKLMQIDYAALPEDEKEKDRVVARVLLQAIKGQNPVTENLRKWFKEKWVRFGPDGKIRGACARGDESEGKPKCLPQAKAHALGKKGRKYAASKKRREDPDAERRGPAKNVATKKKSNEAANPAQQAAIAIAMKKAGKKPKSEGVAEGSIKDLHYDLQDQQWDAIVGYVINGLKKNMDIGRIELNLYKYAGQELFDVDQELEDRGFRDIADLANHIKQHNGKYVPPTDFGLSDLGKGVAEGRFDEPLTGWHIVYRKSGNPVHATPSFETKDQAQKYLMTRMFANHQDYKVVHTAGVGVTEGSTSHAELAKMAHDAYVAASRKCNGTMAAHYLKQYLKHKADAAKDKKSMAEGISLNALSKFANIIPSFAEKLGAAAKQEAKETWQMLQILKLKAQGKATPEQVKWMNKQFVDLVIIAIGVGTLGHAAAAGAAAHGAEGAAAHVSKDALLHFVADAGLETVAEVLSAKFGIDILKKLSHSITTSTGQGIEHSQEKAPQQYGVSPAVAAKNQRDLEQKFQQAKMGFGGMSEGVVSEGQLDSSMIIRQLAGPEVPIYNDKKGRGQRQYNVVGWTLDHYKAAEKVLAKAGYQTKIIGPFRDRGNLSTYRIRILPGESVAEDHEPEGKTVKNSLHTIIRVATHLERQIDDNEDFAEWESETIGSIKDQMVKVMDYEISKKEQQGVAEAAFNPYTSSTSSRNTSPELRSVPIPQDMKHPEWREPTWSFTEIAEKLGVSPKELQVLVLAIGNFPKKSEGLKSSHGSRAYYPRSEIKRWVQSSNIREIIKSRKGIAETQQMCPECGGPAFSDLVLAEKQDACYHKVKSRYKVWPSAYASGALVQCRKKGAANWGKKKTNEAKESPTQDYQKMMNFVQAQRLSGVPPEQQVAVALFKELEKTKAFNKELDAELKAAEERLGVSAKQGELTGQELSKHRGELEKEKAAGAKQRAAMGDFEKVSAEREQASNRQLQGLTQKLEQLKARPGIDPAATAALERQIAELEQKMQDRQGTGVAADKIAELERAIADVQKGETVDASAIERLEQQFKAAETAAQTAKEKVGQVKDYENQIANLNAEIDALNAEINKDEKQIKDIQGALANTVQPKIDQLDKENEHVYQELEQFDSLINQVVNAVSAPSTNAQNLAAQHSKMIRQNPQQAQQAQTVPRNIPGVSETRFYFTVKATLAETLRSEFRMQQDSEGWYLTADQGRSVMLEAQRAFGIPKVKQVKLKEVRISDYTGRAGTIGDENATSPIGSLPRQGRRPA